MTMDSDGMAPGSLRGDDRRYAGYRGVGIRLSEPLDPLVPDAQQAAMFDRGLQQFDKAHLVMLAEQGIISREGAQACLRTLREMEADDLETARAELRGGLHGGEKYLIQRLGMEVGGLIHAGRSSWDLQRASHRIGLRDVILDVMDAVNAYRGAVLDKAARHVDSVMPYYTHGQQAQPSTFAHQLHGFVGAAERDFQRLEGAFARMNISPAGAAAGTATRFPTSRQRVADLLGFDSVSANTRDSSYNYDYMWEMGAALSCAIGSLGFLNDELVLWMGNEFRLVQLDDRYCGTSSIMTHKRNPTAAEQIQHLRDHITGRVPTSYTPAVLAEAGKDIAVSFRLSAGMVETLKVDRDLMLKRSVESWAQAPDLVGVLVEEKGLSWRVGHQIVGIMVRLAEEEGIAPQDATPALLDRAATLFLGEPLSLSSETMARGLDPIAAVQARVATGSPGPREMERQISASRRLLEEDEARMRPVRKRLAEADEALEDAIDALLG
jgi:argininosuccinate lyase